MASPKAQNVAVRAVSDALLGAGVVIAAAMSMSARASGSSTAPGLTSSAAGPARAQVSTLLAGIPQTGNRLGMSRAPVTVTEYCDLVCPVCKKLTLGVENQLITHDVRAGRVKLVYKALKTASATANSFMFVAGQTAALAAGEQHRGWNYIELFYHEQGNETTSYVTDSYLDGLAAQIPGLDYQRWSSDRHSSVLAAQVAADEQQAAAAGYSSTPTILISGPKGQAPPIADNPSSYSQLETAINSVQ
jgi:protein-disulfide isomerase